MAGQPRIFDLALNAVSHGDGQLALDTLAPFVAAYQEKKALSLGELWALPIMLRLALIENLRRAAVAVADGQRARDTAETWAARMLKVADERPSDLIIVVADLARSDVELNTAFVADLARRLQGRGAAMAMPLGWIEQRLHDGGRSIESMFRDDSRLQAEWQLTVANSIGSLRLVGATEWRDFVEVASTVERTLRDDPLKVYARMDFASRDAYRHAVERLARRARRNESDIARSALALAQAAHKEMPARAAAGKAHDPREAHVGHYLVGRGGAALESELGLHPRANARTTLARYLGAIALATLLLAALPAHQLALAAELPTGWWLALLPPLAIVASQLSIALANWLSTLIVAPRMLPRLDFSDGIDPDASTLVVVPTLLTSRNAIDALVDGLEVHHLANRDPRLRFALLTDLRDAANEHEASDDSLVQHAAAQPFVIRVPAATGTTSR